MLMMTPVHSVQPLEKHEAAGSRYLPPHTPRRSLKSSSGRPSSRRDQHITSILLVRLGFGVCPRFVTAGGTSLIMCEKIIAFY